MPHFTMTDGASLYTRIVGQGNPVLILSGLGMSSWQWLPYIYPHLKKHQFIIPDYRGFGGSTHCKIPTHLNAIENHWSDVQHILQQFHIQDIDVIGYSMGATTTMHGLKYGNFSNIMKRYLHIDQTAKIRNDAQWKFGLLGEQQHDFLILTQQIIQLLTPYQSQYQKISQLPKSAQKQLVALWLEFLTLQNPSSKLQQVINKLPQSNIAIYLLPIQSIAYILWYLETYLHHDEDYRETLINLDKPTNFIIGKKSILYPFQGQLQVAGQIKHAKSYLMQNSGHAPLLSEPFQFKKIINQFLHIK